jgi:hypothetical protein
MICDQELKSKSRLTVSQSCRGVEPTLGLVTRYYFLSEGCCPKEPVSSLWDALSDERSGHAREQKHMEDEISVFWDTMLCGLMKVNQHFGRTCHLHLQGLTAGQARD